MNSNKNSGPFTRTHQSIMFANKDPQPQSLLSQLRENEQQTKILNQHSISHRDKHIFSKQKSLAKTNNKQSLRSSTNTLSLFVTNTSFPNKKSLAKMNIKQRSFSKQKSLVKM